MPVPRQGVSPRRTPTRRLVRLVGVAGLVGDGSADPLVVHCGFRKHFERRAASSASALGGVSKTSAANLVELKNPRAQ